MRVTADYLQALQGGLASLAMPAEPVAKPVGEDSSVSVRTP
jgi:hypothetical protein